MKKSFSLFFVWLLAMMCSAQIQVASTGNVGIGDTLTTDVKLFVNTEGDYTAGIYSVIESTETWAPAVHGVAKYTFDRQIAIRGYAAESTIRTNGRSYGVYGVAGNRSSGYNYGIYGELAGAADGAGVFGTAELHPPKINGRYAGYFYGDTIDSSLIQPIRIGEVKITDTGSLEVINGGTVTIEQLSMEDGAELKIH